MALARLSFQKPRRVWEFSFELKHVDPELIHLMIGCPQDWPHDHALCFFNNIVLGEN